MSTLTLEIPEELEAALHAASARRRVPPSILVREALEKALASESEPPTAADQWLPRWRGSLRDTPETAGDEARLSHLLKKHLR
jgi:predicted transcriptional regulator